MTTSTYSDAPVAGASLGQALRREWGIVVLMVLILAGVGAAVGLAVRKPSYTGEARLTVGQLNVSTQGVPGFVAAATGLAAAYARAIDAPGVVVPVAKQLHMSPGTVAGDLTASPITDTPLFRVIATTGNARSAVALANAGARALIKYVDRLNLNTSQRSPALAEFRKAAQQVQSLQLQVQTLKSDYQRTHNPAVRQQLLNISAEAQAALVRRNALATLYGAASSGVSAQNLLSLLAPASRATSDKNSVAEKLIFVGALAGLLLGAALATANANAALRRARVADEP